MLDESLLESEDNKKLSEQILLFRKTLSSLINRDNLVIIIRELVEESPYVSFTSKRAAKFIDKIRPSVSINFDLELAEKNFPKKAFRLQGRETLLKEVLTNRQRLIHDEIAFPLSRALGVILARVSKNKEAEEEKYIQIADRLTEGLDMEGIENRISDVIKEDPELGDLMFSFMNLSACLFPTYENANIDEDLEVLFSYMI
jgi:hypothetical protein